MPALPLHAVVTGKPAYDIRFADVPAEYILGGHCMLCRRDGPVDRLRIEARWNRITWMVDVSKKLRCLGCGNTVANSFVVVGRYA